MKCLPESEYYLTDYHEVYNGHFVALPTKKDKYLITNTLYQAVVVNYSLLMYFTRRDQNWVHFTANDDTSIPCMV